MNLWCDLSHFSNFHRLLVMPVMYERDPVQNGISGLQVETVHSPSQHFLWDIDFSPTDEYRPEVTFENLFPTPEVISFKDRLHLDPQNIRARLDQFQKDNHFEPRRKNFPTTINDLATQIPIALSIIGVHDDLFIEPYVQEAMPPLSRETEMRLALGSRYHESFALTQTSADNQKTHRKFEDSLPSMSPRHLQQLQASIDESKRKHLVIDNSNGAHFLYDVWQKYLTKQVESPLVKEHLRMLRNLCPFEREIDLLTQYVWHTQTGAEILVPESDPSYRKRHEDKISLFMPLPGLIVFMQNDVMFLKTSSKHRNNKKPELTIDAGFSDLKSGSLIIERVKTHPFAQDAFLINTMLMLMGTFEYVQELKTHGPEIVTPYNEYTWVTRNKLKSPAKRHRLRARYHNIDVNQMGQVVFNTYEMTPKQEDWQMFFELVEVLGETMRTIPWTQLKTEMAGRTQDSHYVFSS